MFDNAASILTGSITTQDSDGAVSSLPFGVEEGGPGYGASPSVAGTIKVGTSPVDLPADVNGVPSGMVMLRNLSPTAVDITVTWTPNGGSPQTVVTLSPGGVIIVGGSFPSFTTDISVVASGAGGVLGYAIWFNYFY